MKKSFILKLIITLFLTIIVATIIMPFNSFALDSSYLNPDQFDNNYTQLSDTNIPGTRGSLGGLIKKLLGTILTILRIIAVGWAIMMLISISTKYMTGNAQIKAQLKTDVPTYVTGAALLFGASGILTLIQYFVEDFIK